VCKTAQCCTRDSRGPAQSVRQLRAAADAGLLIEQKRDDEAYAEYQRFLSLNPHDGETLLNVGVVAMLRGHRDEAIARWMEVPDGPPGPWHFVISKRSTAGRHADDQRSRARQAINLTRTRKA
jgi:tetratricopeptide (TPR) repeat protein